MPRQPDIYLELTLAALRKVSAFLAHRSLEVYLKDAMCQSAVERQLEIAGDALGQLRKLSPELFARIPEGDRIVAFRNVLAHGYASLDHTQVYEAAALKAPPLRGAGRPVQQAVFRRHPPHRTHQDGPGADFTRNGHRTSSLPR